MNKDMEKVMREGWTDLIRFLRNNPTYAADVDWIHIEKDGKDNSIMIIQFSNGYQDYRYF